MSLDHSGTYSIGGDKYVIAFRVIHTFIWVVIFGEVIFTLLSDSPAVAKGFSGFSRSKLTLCSLSSNDV
jgi:putative effector of murein hydrolase